MSCLICEYVEACRLGENPRLVHEFPNSYLVAGEHQFYEGYCVLLYKVHVRELHELDRETSSEFYQELMTASEAIAQAYEPWKLNHASYGNAQPHLHWHIFPRYESDPDRFRPVWLSMERFAEHATTVEQVAAIRERLRPFLEV